MDEQAQALWDQYTAYKNMMFEQTNTPEAPWEIIKANNKAGARLAALRYILDTVPYVPMKEDEA